MSAHALSLHRVAPEDWPALSALFDDLTFEQTLTYAQAAARRIGAEAEFICLQDPQGTPVAAACLRIKRVPVLSSGIAWIAGGPMIQPVDHPYPPPDLQQAIFSALRDYAQKAGHIMRLRLPTAIAHDPAALDPIADAAGFQPTDRSPRQRTVIIDCAQDEDTLMQNLHGKWRNALRKALKSGLELDIAPISEAAERFQTLYQEVQSTKGFQTDIPPEFYYTLTGQDFSHDVLFARQDGVDIAGMTIGQAGRRAVYIFGATTQAGRRPNAGHFLMWHSILRCRDQGLRWYDLNGLDPEINPTVAQFKLRTGGTDLIAAGPYEFRPGGLKPTLVSAAETAHGYLKKARA
ncbi:GNAT family N-acetyltransferase [Ruegeria sp. HKCCC2117]|uniref:lipid II:glycine glycyltransferase FemX n=1 Tax=Ruegeria sp. HKCCC2117 TaxID=2682992 RepID=UPI001488C587|nr:GNAT family N-acetyltransferase [Ruegeria sp. HKCCC2117]